MLNMLPRLPQARAPVKKKHAALRLATRSLARVEALGRSAAAAAEPHVRRNPAAVAAVAGAVIIVLIALLLMRASSG